MALGHKYSVCNESGKFWGQEENTIIIRKSNHMNLMSIWCFYYGAKNKYEISSSQRSLQLHKKTQLHTINSVALIMRNTQLIVFTFSALNAIVAHFSSHALCSFHELFRLMPGCWVKYYGLFTTTIKWKVEKERNVSARNTLFKYLLRFIMFEKLQCCCTIHPLPFSWLFNFFYFHVISARFIVPN